MTPSSSLSGLVVCGLGSLESSDEAFLHHLTLVIIEEKTPDTDRVARKELVYGEVGEDKVPDEWLEETFDGSLNEICWHYCFIKINYIIYRKLFLKTP